MVCGVCVCVCVSGRGVERDESEIGFGWREGMVEGGTKFIVYTQQKVVFQQQVCD